MLCVAARCELALNFNALTEVAALTPRGVCESLAENRSGPVI